MREAPVAANAHIKTHTPQVDKTHLDWANSLWRLLFFLFQSFLPCYFINIIIYFLIAVPSPLPPFLLQHALIRCINHSWGNELQTGLKFTALGFILCNHSWINIMNSRTQHGKSTLIYVLFNVRHNHPFKFKLRRLLNDSTTLTWFYGSDSKLWKQSCWKIGDIVPL